MASLSATWQLKETWSQSLSVLPVPTFSSLSPAASSLHVNSPITVRASTSSFCRKLKSLPNVVNPANTVTKWRFPSVRQVAITAIGKDKDRSQPTADVYWPPASWQDEASVITPLHRCTRMALKLPAVSHVARSAASSTSSLTAEATGVTANGLFSVSDEVLSERGFSVTYSRHDVDLEQLNTLFTKVGFPTRKTQKLQKALDHTMALLVVKFVASGRLVGFARATGDDVFNAIIWDVVVDPEHQGSGLGKAIMERLMASLLAKGICNIALYAEPNVVGFYRPLGFISDPDGVRGMAYKRTKLG